MKKIISVIISVIIATSLFACSKGENANAKETAIQTATDELIIYNAGINELPPSIIQEYKKLYPNVNVILKQAPAWDFADDGQAFTEYHEKMNTEIMSGKGTDIIYNIKNSEKKMNSGVFADMTPYIANDPDFNSNDYYEAVMEAGMLDGKRYIMPLSFDISVLITTQRLLDETKLDVNDLTDYWKFDEQINKYVDGSSKIPLISFGMRSIGDFFVPSGITKIDFASKNVSLDTPEFKRGAETIRKACERLAWELDMTAGGPFQAALTNKEYVFSHESGSTISSVINTYIYALGQTYESPEQTDTPVFAPIKNINGGINAVIRDEVSIASNSKNKLNAYNFVKLLTSNFYQSKEYGLASVLSYPVRKESTKKVVDNYILAPSITNGDGTSTTYIGTVPQEEREKLISYADEITSCTFNHEGYYMLTQLMEPYYKGEMSYEDAIKGAEDKMTIYISE